MDSRERAARIVEEIVPELSDERKKELIEAIEMAMWEMGDVASSAAYGELE